MTGPMETIVRPGLVALMALSFAMASFELIHLLTSWSAGYPVVFAVVASLEGYYTMRFLTPRILDSGDRLKLHISEALLLVVALQIALDIMQGLRPVVNGLPRFDNSTLLFAAIIAMLWWGSGQTAKDLRDLARDPRDFMHLEPPMERLRYRFFRGGAVLFVVAGLDTIGIRTALNPLHGFNAAPVFNVLVYFVAGMVLLGQARYAALLESWGRQGRTVSAGMGGRWTRASVVLLASAAMLALLLPTGGSFYLLDLVRNAINLGFVVLSVLLVVILSPIIFLLHFLHLTGAVATEHHRVLAPAPHHPPPPSGHVAPWLGAVLFWLVAGGILAFLLAGVLAERRGRVDVSGMVSRVRALLSRLWAALRGRLRGYAAAVAQRMPRRVPAMSVPIPVRGPLRLLRVASLRPRDQVLYYYLSTIRRAERRGIGRAPAQTPGEYELVLSEQVPEAGAEIRGLTSQFVEARYSFHDIARPAAVSARDRWERIKSMLRRVSGGIS